MAPPLVHGYGLSGLPHLGIFVKKEEERGVSLFLSRARADCHYLFVIKCTEAPSMHVICCTERSSNANVVHTLLCIEMHLSTDR